MIRLGFIEWVEGCAKQPRLFMSFTHNTKEGYGRNLGRWFGTFLTKIGMKENGLVFHSLRHTAITRMRQAGVELSLVQEIVGHERDTVDLSRFRAAPSSRLSHFPFESDGAFPAQC
jgi:integrase